MLRQASTLFSWHGGGERTLVIYIEEDQVVVERRSLIVSLVYGFRCSPSLSGCHCLYLIRVAYTWNATVRRDQHLYILTLQHFLFAYYVCVQLVYFLYPRWIMYIY